MKKYLEEYIEIIKKLPLKERYTREDIINEDFLIERNGYIEIYYSPHNEYVNHKAKILVVGITPGFQQMSTAINTARVCIEKQEPIENIRYKCKVAGRFSGAMRKNIITMLDDIDLDKVLNIESCRELFEEEDYLLHTISLVPYPIFIKGKNYSGHSPKLIKNDFLMSYVYENFISELENLEELLIIPLGRAVEEVFEVLIDKKTINRNQIVKGFPHPSGANVNRIIQLEENKLAMTRTIREWFNK